jgi:hypothetical protein
MAALASTIVAMLVQLLPLIGGTSSTIASILNVLIQLIPIVTQEVVDLLPAIKNIIAALSANPAATTDQLATLAALDAQVDAAFEAAAQAAGVPPAGA